MAGRPERYQLSKYKLKLNEHKKVVRQILKEIPSHYSIVANENLAPHLSQRFQIHQFEDYQRRPKKVTYALDSDLVVIDQELTLGDMTAEVQKIQNSGYKVVYERDGFFVLQRKDLSKPLALTE